MTETNMQAARETPRLDDYLISFFGGAVFGGTLWAVAAGIVKIIQATAPPGINLLQTITRMGLVPPPGLDLSGITIVLNPISPETGFTLLGTFISLLGIVEAAYVWVPILIGVITGYAMYRRLLKLPS